MLRRYLMHEKLIIRFAALLVVVLLLFFGSWTLSYFFLPEGLLRGQNIAQVLAGDDLAGNSVWLEWLRIFLINLGAMVILIIAPNYLRTEKDYTLGYNTLSLLTIYLGIVIGTNSFSIAMEGRMAPSIEILGGSGLYEIIAYVLGAAATATMSKYRLVGTWPKQTIEKIKEPRTKAEMRGMVIGLSVAIVILLVACGWEAYRISLVV